MQSFSTYFPIISHSRLTLLPIFLSKRIVSFPVCGITDTEKSQSLTEATVRLIPSIAMDPFSMMYFSSGDGVCTVIQTAFPSRLIFEIRPVSSICPATMCPPKRPSAAMARSRLTPLPICSSPRLLRRKVFRHDIDNKGMGGHGSYGQTDAVYCDAVT